MTPGLFHARKYYCMSAGSGIFRGLDGIEFEKQNSFARKLATQIEAPSNEVMGPEAYKGSRVGFYRNSYPLRVCLGKGFVVA